MSLGYVRGELYYLYLSLGRWGCIPSIWCWLESLLWSLIRVGIQHIWRWGLVGLLDRTIWLKTLIWLILIRLVPLVRLVVWALTVRVVSFRLLLGRVGVCGGINLRVGVSFNEWLVGIGSVHVKIINNRAIKLIGYPHSCTGQILEIRIRQIMQCSLNDKTAFQFYIS